MIIVASNVKCEKIVETRTITRIALSVRELSELIRDHPKYKHLMTGKGIVTVMYDDRDIEDDPIVIEIRQTETKQEY